MEIEEHVSQVLPPDELAKVDPSVWEGANVLTNSEASLLLTNYIQAKREKDPAFEPNSVMARTHEYATKFSTVVNEENTRQIRTILLQDYHMQLHEVGIIANLMPETAEEARTLVPSLKDPVRYPDDVVLEQALAEIARFRER